MSNSPRPQRRDRLIREQNHDPYFNKQKIKEPASCPECGSVYRKGAWHWEDRPKDARDHICPACKRINDKLPAGYVSLSGAYLELHREEILNLVKNIAEQAKQTHPLKRIMDIERDEKETLITLTDTHLAREIGNAIHHSQGGNLDLQYPEGGDIVRLVWQRDE